jgi:hypothetical protein
MIQRVVVTAEAQVALKPLIESALRSEARLLELGLERTQQRLHDFEAQYGLASEEFERRFQQGEVEVSLDFIEWAGEIKTYRLLQVQVQILQEAELN